MDQDRRKRRLERLAQETPFSRGAIPLTAKEAVAIATDQDWKDKREFVDELRPLHEVIRLQGATEKVVELTAELMARGLLDPGGDTVAVDFQAEPDLERDKPVLIEATLDVAALAEHVAGYRAQGPFPEEPRLMRLAGKRLAIAAKDGEQAGWSITVSDGPLRAPGFVRVSAAYRKEPGKQDATFSLGKPREDQGKYTMAEALAAIGGGITEELIFRGEGMPWPKEETVRTAVTGRAIAIYRQLMKNTVSVPEALAFIGCGVDLDWLRMATGDPVQPWTRIDRDSLEELRSRAEREATSEGPGA